MKAKKFSKLKFSRVILSIAFIILGLGILVIISQTLGIDTSISWVLKTNPDAKRIFHVKQIKKALASYYKENEQYPLATAVCSSWGKNEKEKKLNYIPDIDKYLPQQPHDPEERVNGCPDYCYQSTDKGTDYKLSYSLNERSSKAMGEYAASCGNYIKYEICGKDKECDFFDKNYAVPQPEKTIPEKDLQRLEDIKKLIQSLESFYKDNLRYPASKIICSSWAITEEKMEANYIPELDKYLEKQPHDPDERPSTLPDYCYRSDGVSYELNYYLAQDSAEAIGSERSEMGPSGNFIRYGICAENQVCPE